MLLSVTESHSTAFQFLIINLKLSSVETDSLLRIKLLCDKSHTLAFSSSFS